MALIGAAQVLIGMIAVGVVAYTIGFRNGERRAEERHQMDEFNEWVATHNRYVTEFPKGDT